MMNADDPEGFLKRTTFNPVPPPGFDPLTAQPEELDFFGLPRKPNPVTHPAYFAFWQKLFSPPLRFQKAEFQFAQPVLERRAPPNAIRASSRHQRSQNWSGVYVTPRDGLRFIEVHGSWHVPPVSRPTGAPTTLEHRSSTWVGLDGQRRYLHSSLPQIGTVQIVAPGNPAPTPVYSAWLQWWVRGEVTLPVPIPLAIHPGDEIMCSLFVLDDSKARFLIENRTTGVPLSTFDVITPSVTLPSGGPIQLVISGATAEWVMERPTSVDTQELYPLTAYNTVDFGEAIAVSALEPLAAGREEHLLGARLIDMYEIRENPHRTATISVASRPGAHAATTTYRT